MIWSEIALICVSVVLVIVVIAWAVSVAKRKGQGAENRVDDVYVKDGVRYTKSSDVVDEKGDVKVTLNKGDVMLERGEVYVVGKDLLAGKFTVLLADENLDAVNMRVGGLVREYKHFSSVVLTEGDEISAVSANVILR